MLWATTPNGKRLPLELEPARAPFRAERVYLLVERGGDWRLAVELRDVELKTEAATVDGLELRHCHFDTCERRPAPRERYA